MWPRSLAAADRRWLAILTGIVGNSAQGSHLDRGRDLSNAAWKLRATAASLTGDPAESEGTARLVREKLTEAVMLCREAGADRELATSLRRLGHAEQDAGRNESATACYEGAMTLYAEHSDPPTLDYANAIRSMAILKEALGKTDEARYLWKRAKALYAAVSIAAGIAECDANLARLA